MVPADVHRRAARLVLVHDGRVLVEHVGGLVVAGRRTWWELPGGGIDPGETTAEAARRELREETGYLDVEVGPVVATARVRAIGARRVAEQHATYHAAWLRSDRRVAPDLEPLEVEDLLEVVWLTPDELAELPTLVPPSVATLARDVVAGRFVPRRLGDHDLRVVVDGDQVELPVDAPSDPSPAVLEPGGALPGDRAVVLDDRVVRDAAPWTEAVHAWLAYLHERGIDAVPRPLGIDRFGREAVSFVSGAVTGQTGAAIGEGAGPGAGAEAAPAETNVWPEPLRSDEGMAAVGALLTQLRRAARDFTPPPGLVWRGGPAEPGDGQVICHGDVGHGNVVWRDDGSPALIDWEFAHPGPPLRDLAEAACWLVPLVAFDHAARGFEVEPDRRARLAALARGGGVAVDELLTAVDHYLDVESARVRELGTLGISPWDDYLEAGQPAGFARVRTYLAEHPVT